MIRLMTEQNKIFALQQQGSDPFLCRILCIENMYGAYPFADCWVQMQEGNDHPLAYVSKMDGVLTLFATPNADFDEIGTFLDAVGTDLVMCQNACAEKLGIEPTRTGAILKWHGKQTVQHIDFLNPDLGQVYEVLKSCESVDFRLPLYESFHLDMSHKIRHNGAKVVGLVKYKQLAACAMTVAETEQAAVIGAVAVKPDYQGKGLGKTMVEGLVEMCSDKNQTDIYVYCNTEKNRQFYESLGFVNCGTWAEIERN